jgi:hypothetical protein
MLAPAISEPPVVPGPLDTLDACGRAPARRRSSAIAAVTAALRSAAVSSPGCLPSSSRPTSSRVAPSRPRWPARSRPTARRIGGDLTVRSTMDAGTTFTLTLPAG